ncbi:FAD-binding oxidoreductase [Cryptosporangium aurantiacum]|uniref:Glycolate oxidase FAD binding subunit n=1 Tax=Cryptosporangium aurantiacum TaxID=134849 RepID=A0A1M7RJC1_9ACTN|nr:FAD-binding oxidoreductase [Cryptosporangium aurantiacum]SHN46262.1 glycolate oxidase FAD binding subunit [Cryptosporangium aurantiacum]
MPLAPESVADAAEILRDLGEAGTTVRPVGSGSRAGWGGPDDAARILTTAGLRRIIEHNPGDFTAVLEAGVPLADAQAEFASAGQWLALDPGSTGTIGGLVATADSGPARHRYGGVRDLIIGVTLVLSDGTVARSGGRVIKNVAGYDLGKLFTGSYGTLGLVAEVAVRLHPLPSGTATAVASFTDPSALAEAAAGLSRRPLEALCLDARWRAGAGQLLTRFGGVTASAQAAALGGLPGAAAAEVVEDDAELWEAQRAGQRSADGVVLKVSARPTDLARVLRLADDVGAAVVARAALGLAWLVLPAERAGEVGAVRAALAPRAVVTLDGGDRVESPWPEIDPGAAAVMQRIKARFDPARIFRPGAFVGGL